MPYKDADRRRACNLAAQHRRRARMKGDTMGRDLIGNTDNENGKGVLHAELAAALEVDLEDDHGGLGDLGQVTREAVDEQTKVLHRMMSRRDLAQWLIDILPGLKAEDSGY